MAVLRTHSELIAREGWWMSRLTLPYGLDIAIDVGRTQVSSTVPRGDYIFDSRVVGRIVKTRGELVTDNTIFHIEIVSVKNAGLTPLLVRIWDLQCETLGMELLVDGNVSWFRQMQLGILTNKSIIGQLIDYVVEETEYFSANYLTPNISQEELEQRYDFGAQYLKAIIHEIFDIFYLPGLNHQNLPYINGILSGDLPTISLVAYNHPGTFTDKSNVNMVIETISEYQAIIRFALIQYDHFDMTFIFNENNPPAVIIIDSMSGPYFPFRNQDDLLHNVEVTCYAFINEFFQSTRTVDGTNHAIFYTNDGVTYEVHEIRFIRTMDEYLTVIFKLDGMIFEKVYDLVALSLMSPCLGMTSPVL